MSKDLEATLQRLVTAVTHHPAVRAIGLSGGDRPWPTAGAGDIDLFVYCTEIPTRIERREILAAFREAEHIEI